MKKKEFLDRTALLITGCMVPNSNTPKLVLRNQNERKEQYLESIKYYIIHSKVKKIIYCDNSNAKPELELMILAKKNNVCLEWISFKGDVEKTVQYGKGYGESEIVNYAFEHSQLIKKCSYFVKITGRLIVKNLNLLIETSNAEIRFYPNRTEDRRLYINTRIYMMPIDVYRNYFRMSGSYVNDNENIYLEHAFGKCIMNGAIKYKKFWFVPWVEGVSGSTGRIYKPSAISYLKDMIKLWIY